MSGFAKWSGWLAALVLAAGCRLAQAVAWYPLGPYGGSAFSIAADPQDPEHLYLGTATGWIYDSHDGGVNWRRVSHIENRNDLVINHIVVDTHNPRRLIASAYSPDHPDGGIFISSDTGVSWYSQSQMRGQSIRSLARSSSNPAELIAGTMSGVFRSRDNANHWERISPADNKELIEVESIAIDPAQPDVIYAGTWHLPWKSEDGGASWKNIKDGIIDDSDVFSIIVDPDNSDTVYASACSGIYKSTNGGNHFKKVEGIPKEARRTRKLAQDPSNLKVVFAGTTEGLYRSDDAGAQWKLLTSKEIVVNDVYIDPTNPHHVVMATDRGGVLRSEDGGETFQPSNTGFSARQVRAYAADTRHPSTIYVGVVNDKETGGVFVSRDEGIHWQQQSDGLRGLDIFSLGTAPDGTMLAGTSHGIYRLDEAAWVESNARGEDPPTEGASPTKMGAIAAPRKTAAKPAGKPATRPAKRSAISHASSVKIKPAAFFQKKSSAAPHPTKRGPGSAAAKPGKPHSKAISVKSREAPHPISHVSPAALRAAVTTRVAAAQAAASRSLDAVVYSIATTADRLYAGTAAGLFVGTDQGRSWTPVASLQMPDVRYITALPPAEGTKDAPGAGKLTLLAAGYKRLALSLDSGESWDTVPLPAELTQINAVAVDGQRDLWVGGREGVWYSTDYGESWKSIRDLFVTDVGGLFYDAAQKRVLVTAQSSSIAFAVAVPDHKVTHWDTGWRLRFVRPAGDHLIGATMYDGMVVQPEMVDTPFGAPAPAAPGKTD